MKTLYAGSRHRIQTLKEAPAKGLQPQPTKGWAVTEEVLDNVQHLLTATHPAIVPANPCQ